MCVTLGIASDHNPLAPGPAHSGGNQLDAFDSALSNNLSTFMLVAMIVGGAALIASIGLMLRVRALTRPLAHVRDSQDTVALMSSILHTIDSAETKLDRLTAAVSEHVTDSQQCLRHVGLVRYDAFEDIAGQQSYSLCLLDAHKNGLMITYLTGKNSTRSYAAAVNGGEASRKLADEERRALDAALERATA